MSTIPMTDRASRPSQTVLESGVPDRCEIVRDFAQLESLAADWERLWQADPAGEVFQSFAWAQAWWRACGSSVEIYTPVVYAGSEVLGILPLVRRDDRLEFLGSPHADYGDVVCVEASTPQVLEWSLRELLRTGGWREGFLDGLQEESRIVRHARKIPRDLRRALQLVPSERCYTIMLAQQGAAILDGLARKQHLRRRQNKLEKTGQVAFRHLETVPEALQHLELFFISQRRRRAIHGKESAADSEEFRQLLRYLVQSFDLRNALHFGVLELDAKPLAWHLSFEAHDKWVFYQQTFDVDAWDLAPGEALLRYLLLYAKDRVTREFDFTRGDEPFKARFGNHERLIYQMWLQPHGLRGSFNGIKRQLSGAVQGRVRRLRAAVKADKGLFERWRAARTWLHERKQKWAGKARDAETKASTDVASHGFLSKHEILTVFASPVDVNASSSPACVSPAGLGDLVDFAQANPHAILPTQVLDLRERFRQGDLAFVERHGEQPMRVAWITKRALTDVLQLPALPEAAPAMLLYEFWETERVEGQTLSAFIHALGHAVAVQGMSLWICCRASSATLREAVEQLGWTKLFEIRFGKLLRANVEENPHTP